MSLRALLFVVAVDSVYATNPTALLVPVPSTNIVKWMSDSDTSSSPLKDYPRQDADQSASRAMSYVWDDAANGPVRDQNTFMTWFPYAIKCTFKQSSTIDQYASIKAWWEAEGISDHYRGVDIDTALAGYSGYSSTTYKWAKATLGQVYSLIDFTGACGNEPPSSSTPPDDSKMFINTTMFEVPYGDNYTSSQTNPRWIDGQVWGDENVQGSMQMYDSTGQLQHQDASVFGVNFPDGRIKSYPKTDHDTSSDQIKQVMFVVNNTYSQRYVTKSDFKAGDSTVTDARTSLEWERNDSQQGMTWEAALQRCAQLTTDGHSDWRLPSVKELQTIVRYDTPVITSTTRSRITDLNVHDPAFHATKVLVNGTLPVGGSDETYYGYYWSATTHFDFAADNPGQAAYIPFGSALGFFTGPGGSTGQLTDVHGAGAQRSDPKSVDGVPHGASWNSDGSYYYFGPQGDVIRPGNNLVRCVRTAALSAAIIMI